MKIGIATFNINNVNRRLPKLLHWLQAARPDTRHVLRVLDAEVHPSCVHGLKHFFGRPGVALRDAELLKRFRLPCARDCKGFHVEIQHFTQLRRHFIRADHRTKLDDARS